MTYQLNGVMKKLKNSKTAMFKSYREYLKFRICNPLLIVYNEAQNQEIVVFKFFNNVKLLGKGKLDFLFLKALI